MVTEFATALRRWTPRAAFRRLRQAGYWFDPRDIPLFFKGAATDARIDRLRRQDGNRAAFETVYREHSDPWASVVARYRYQSRKYDVVVGLLPPGRRFHRALDLGCGLGTLSHRLTDRADQVLGLDLAQSAIDRAQAAHGHHPKLSFAQADILALPAALDGQFDLVVIADALYYLSPLDDQRLPPLAARIAELLAPGGLCVLVNHFFFSKDPESARSRRIHRAFEQTPSLCNPITHWRPFYLTTFLDKVPALSDR